MPGRAEPEIGAIVVGSGPSGVAVARPLLDRGARVVLLDGGRVRDERLVPQRAYHDLRRRDPEQWRLFLGPRLEALAPGGPPSPKFRAPASRFAFEGFEAVRPPPPGEFVVAGSLAAGGFSTIWGAGLGVYDDDDLADFPLEAADLAPSYRGVAEWIGVSGFAADDLATALDASLPRQADLRPAENAARLLARYAARRETIRARGVRLGRPRVAVLTEDRPGRRACALCDACVWGCAHGSIWSAGHALELLRRHPRLDYRPGHVVERIDRAGDGYRITALEPAGGEVAWTARRVLLAAGTLATTRLVLELEGRDAAWLPLAASPTAGFALLLPGRVGAGLATRDYSMAQLSFAEGDGGDRSYGNLFPASGLPAALLIERMPLSRPGAVRLLRALQPAMLLGNAFLPGRYSSNRVRLERDAGGRARLAVRAEVPDEQRRRFAVLRRRLRGAFRGLGAWMLPSSFRIAPPGSDLRYSGTFPMRRDPGPGEVDLAGELHGHPGLHLVDLSIFPAMGAKHPTLTLMANADRIGRLLADRWARGAPDRS